MPFKSKAQMRFLFAFHPGIARRWVRKYGKKYLKRLPNKKKKKEVK